jgi:hypothetical protein
MIAVVNATATPRRFEADGISLDLAPLEVALVGSDGRKLK